jgi:succinate dehydrogenase / fumarate reductase membrane anchor subunit
VSGLRDPLAVARGLGSAKGGTGHWWLQRVTSVVLFFLTPWFLIFALGMVGQDQNIVQATLSRPLNAVLMILWILSLFWHAQLGVQVVAEDYVHGWSEWAIQLLARVVCAAGAIAGVISVCRVYFMA